MGEQKRHQQNRHSADFKARDALKRRRRSVAQFTERMLHPPLAGVHRLRLHVRSCVSRGCRRYHVPYRPEEEGHLALPQYEFGLDVIALVGALRYQGHRSVPEIHQDLEGRGLVICERTVTNLLDRYDELLALRLSDCRRV